MFCFPQATIWFPIGDGEIEIIDLVLSDGFKDFSSLVGIKVWRERSGITVQGNQISLRIYKIPKIIVDSEPRTMVQLE